MGKIMRSAVILAAGQGTRMLSERPKPLTKICGKPMVGHLLDAISQLGGVDKVVVVVGHGAGRVRASISEFVSDGVEIGFVEQKIQRGTGDALAAAMTMVPDPVTTFGKGSSEVLVIPADTPLLSAETLRALFEEHKKSSNTATVLTATMSNPYGYGRVIRSKTGQLRKIVEERDATDEEKMVSEINTSIYLFDPSVLPAALRRIEPTNSQGEYYLTDVIEVLSQAGYRIGSKEIPDPMDVLGVNDRIQLAEVEAVMRERINHQWMARGVTLVDAKTTYIDATVEIGADTTIWPNSILSGKTVIGSHVEVGPNTSLIDCWVGDRSRLRQLVASGAHIGEACDIGPFVVLSPGVKVESGHIVGPFLHLE